jgi:shikimate kinase
MNIVLTGMRGSGKSVTGKLLAEKLKFKFCDTDFITEEAAKMKISQIVNGIGWNQWRIFENEAIGKLKTVENTVIATGGGVVLSVSNMSILKALGKIFYLEASVSILVERICKDYRNRPRLTNEANLFNELQTVFTQRKNLYEKYADYTIKTENKRPEEVSVTILNCL